ncbi:MAG: hypothetical protein ACK5HY_11695 [Parahaliea sp.]
MGLGLEQRFERYCDGIAGILSHADCEEPARWYIKGLMLSGERKSIGRGLIHNTVKLSERLESLHPEAAAHLDRLDALASQTTDGELLQLCTEFIRVNLEGRHWQPPRELSAREEVFISFTEQFMVAVSGMQPEQISDLLQFASADEVYGFINALYVADMTQRLDIVMGRVLS